MKRIFGLGLAIIFVLMVFVSYASADVLNSTTTPSSTDASIAKATKLTLKDQTSKNGYRIHLTWTASKTTTIDGYTVYRKDNAATDYSKIASVLKGVQRYDDNDTFTPNQTYYYIIRAHEGTQESPDSNLVSFSAKDLATLQAVDNKPIVTLSSIENLNNLPINRALIFLALGVSALAAILYLFRRGLKLKAPFLYRNLFDTSVKTTGGKILLGLLAIAIIAMFLTIFWMFNKDGFSIFIG